LRKAKEKKPFSLEEQIEWIAVAFVLALTVRCFVVEAYQIPTGSMAPTLYGKHYLVTCPACGGSFNLKLDEGAPLNLAFSCPFCSRGLSEGGTRVRRRGGDRILVSKNLYFFTRPERWDIFVFKSPEQHDANKNFVKRLIGLPGERVEVRNGQVFINGDIARKPRRIQDTLWQDVYNGLHKESAAGYWITRGSWAVTPKGLLMSQADRIQTVEYAGPITDAYSYNGDDGRNVVSDLLVSAHCVMDESAEHFAAAVWADSDTWKVVFRPAGKALRVELRHNEAVKKDALLLLPSTTDFDFTLSVVDAVAEVSVNGVTAGRHEWAPSPESMPSYTADSGVFFQGATGPILVRDVEIKRDIYYSVRFEVPDRSVRETFVRDVPEGHYLALGDNSPISRDSREWKYVPAENVLGKAFFVFWPLTRVGPVY
jgi:signal peptidase I